MTAELVKSVLKYSSKWATLFGRERENKNQKNTANENNKRGKTLKSHHNLMQKLEDKENTNKVKFLKASVGSI